MARICRFYHSVAIDEDKCSQGHYLCATLDCQVRGCKYTTRPLSSTDVKPAIEIMKIHIRGAHPELENIQTEKDDANNLEAADDAKKTRDIDPNENETCPRCFKIFFSKKNVKRHIKTQHLGIGRQKCSDCDKTFASKAAVDYHMKKGHSKDSHFNCGECGEIFTDYEDLKLHLKKHRKPVQHKCEKCKSFFSSRSNLNRHISEEHNIVKINTMKMNVKSYPFKCDKCPYFTCRKYYFEQHKLKVHSHESLEMFSCGHCLETFKYKQNLRRHERKFHASHLLISDILNTVIANLK